MSHKDLSRMVWYGVTAPCPEGGITAGQGIQRSRGRGLGLLCNSFMPVVHQARLSHHRELRPLRGSVASALRSAANVAFTGSVAAHAKIGSSVSRVETNGICEAQPTWRPWAGTQCKDEPEGSHRCTSAQYTSRSAGRRVETKASGIQSSVVSKHTDGRFENAGSSCQCQQGIPLRSSRRTVESGHNPKEPIITRGGYTPTVMLVPRKILGRRGLQSTPISSNKKSSTDHASLRQSQKQLFRDIRKMPRSRCSA